MREIIFFKNSAGKSPVKDFLSALSAKEKQKVFWVLALIRDIQIVPKDYFKKL
jgi:hypothetical protein